MLLVPRGAGYVKSVIPNGANPFPHFSVLISAPLLPDYSSARYNVADYMYIYHPY